MEYTKLGKTDIEISKLCVGCMAMGKRNRFTDYRRYKEKNILMMPSVQ